MSADIAPEVRDFLRAYIPSHEHLDVLLYLSSDPQPWTAQDVAERLKLPVEAAEDALTHLWRVKLLEARSMASRRSGFAYVPASSQIEASVRALAIEYATNRFSVVQLIGAFAIERIRNAAINHFADAFVLKAKARKDG